MTSDLPLKSSYSKRRTLPVRAAMALALKRHLEATGLFAKVYDVWPTPEQKYITPAACVLPGPWLYSDARFTPTLMQETWEPKGMPGWGLYKTTDFEGDFELQIACATDPEREFVLQGIEDIWVADEVLMDHVNGPRNSLILTMPEYWGLQAELTLKSGRVVDDADSAMRGYRDAVITVTGHSAKAQLGPVRPMRVTIRSDTA